MKPQITIAMHGVTGRMGTNQHLIRSILAIMKQGGVPLPSGERITIKPILVGRSEDKLKHLAQTVAQKEIGQVVDWSTDLSGVLKDPSVDILFDASSTLHRSTIVQQAVEAGKAVYCEKPIATDQAAAFELAQLCESAGVKNGVVQDKLWLPGMCQLRHLIQAGFFGDILSVRGEFGYWVFTGHEASQPPQRPSWNYRHEDGGGIMIDMFCHWHYLIEDLFGPIERVLAHASVDLPERLDEAGQPYRCTADDSAYAFFILKNGVTCQFNSSWATRVRRDDLLTVQVDGTQGSAVVGLRDCWVQSLADTPRPTWNPDIPQPINFFEGWKKLPNESPTENAFKVQWEKFIRHVSVDEPFPWTLRQGAAGVALANAGETSWKEQRWVNFGALTS